MPKISTIVPLYNGERFIRDAIESVLCQTFQDFEVIVVDDGSTDRGKDIVLAIDGPVKYLQQENCGTAVARNRGFLASRGEFIAFLDQDDRWYPRKLEIQTSLLGSNSELGTVYSDVDLIDELGNVLEHEYLKNRRLPDSESEFLSVFPKFPQPHPYPSTILMRRQVFSESGMFDPFFKENCHEDTELWFRIVGRKLGGFYFHPESLVQRRCHAFQGGQNQKAWDENWLICLQKLVELYSAEPLKNAHIKYLIKKLARMLSRQGKVLVSEGDIEEGRMYLKKSFELYPLYWKNLGRIVRSYLRVG
ncbi:MAG TPA: glycosyltransferase [Candidatus Binatia bacterium]|jgi:glycosyltransferase involved in cell wall biosynthesis